MIDIIIPVYNTPINDLKRCFDSVLNQTYNKYNVYIIDDGSNKKTKEFLDDYSNKYNNFIIKHTNNKGISTARNIGIDMSKSKYITFLDSDDELDKNFLKEAYKLCEDNDLDIIIGGYNEIENDEVKRVRKSLKGLHIYDKDNKELFLKKLISAKLSDDNKEIGDLPTGRIYTRVFKRDSIKNKFNENIKVSEDTLFMIDYIYKVNKIGIIDKVWYNYHKNNYSITRKDNIGLIPYLKELKKEVNKYLKKETNKVLKEAYKVRIDKINNYIEELKNM